MNHIFRADTFIRVPDGTDVSAFMNASDSTQTQLRGGALESMSIACGRLEPGVQSWIHVHPIVTQVTYVAEGSVAVRMKGPEDQIPYDLQLRSGEAVLTQPGTLFQLRNRSDSIATVLYIVSPPYAFEMVGSEIVYDDAVMIAKAWEDLEVATHQVPAPVQSRGEANRCRAQSMRRLAMRKGHSPKALAGENVRPLPVASDYIAPDGSQIRLLVEGTSGGLAHCVLPAGRISKPVQHSTVEELWYVLSGQGQIWRWRSDEDMRIDDLREGDSISIPVGTAFQFRASESADLKLLLATMPPWPGSGEAQPAVGLWSVSV